MAQDQNHFAPETVDEQLDLLLPASSSADSHGPVTGNRNAKQSNDRELEEQLDEADVQIVQILQNIYQGNNSAEDLLSLTYARRRIVQERETDRQGGQFVGARGSHFPATPGKHVARTRWRTLIAAVVIISLLAGTWLVLARVTPAEGTPPPIPQSKHKNVYVFTNGALIKLNGQNGDPLWTHPISGVQGQPLTISELNGTIYAIWSTRAYALDARSGSERWQRDFIQDQVTGIPNTVGTPTPGSGQPVMSSPTPGASLSLLRDVQKAIVVNDTIYLLHPTGALSALNITNGSVKWTRMDLFVRDGQMVVDQDNMLYFWGSDFQLHALNGTDGKQRWSFGGDDNGQATAQYSFPGIVIHRDIIYYIGNDTLYALSAKDQGHVLWTENISRSLIDLNEQLYIVGDTLLVQNKLPTSSFSAFDVSGSEKKLLWTSEEEYDLNLINGQILVANGRLVLYKNEGSTRSVQAVDLQKGPAAIPLWTVQDICPPTDGCVSQWAEINNGKLFFIRKIMNGDKLLFTFSIIDMSNGETTAGRKMTEISDDATQSIDFGPTSSDGLIYLFSTSTQPENFSGTVYAFRLSDGTLAWSHTVQETSVEILPLFSSSIAVAP
jgi:outer membrane protein assembly factor BamB